MREYATQEWYEVLEEVTDPGQSGASLERPGIDRVRDLVAAGNVSVVLAQDRDRFSREPAYHYLLKKEFEEHGCSLQALNDRGDNSPEGELMDGVFDQFAKFERAKTAQRTRRGKKRKAREGKIVAPRKIAYGFKLNPERDGYIVDEESMPTVRRIFEMVAEGTSLQAIKQVLEAEGIPTPSGGERWSRSTLRALVKNDLYFPHAFEEVASLVSPTVAAGLDTSESYGIWWSAKHDWRVLARIKTPEGYYRERRSHGLKPKEEWIAVPVPYAGVPREVAERARRTIDHNFRHPSKSRRIWELTGGLLHCGECGRKMHTHQVAPVGRKPYFYYQCSRKAEERSSSCSNKYHKAEQLERDVRDAVSSLICDKQRLEEQIERRIELERELCTTPMKRRRSGLEGSRRSRRRGAATRTSKLRAS